MKGTLKKVELKEFTNKTKGNKFSKVIVSVDCEKDNGDIITLRGDMSEDYARKYFKYCETTTKDAIGREVEIVTARRKYVVDNVDAGQALRLPRVGQMVISRRPRGFPRARTRCSGTWQPFQR